MNLKKRHKIQLLKKIIQSLFAFFVINLGWPYATCQNKTKIYTCWKEQTNEFILLQGYQESLDLIINFIIKYLIYFFIQIFIIFVVVVWYDMNSVVCICTC